MPNAGLFAVSVFAYSYNLFLLIFAVLGALSLVVALRRRRRIVAALAGGLTAAVLVAVIVPTAQLICGKSCQGQGEAEFRMICPKLRFGCHCW